MTKYIRILIAIAMILGLVLLAKNQAAWAAQPADDSDDSALAQIGPYAPWQREDPCEREKFRTKHPEKCNGGSVRPPHPNIHVCERGEFSVGGVAVVDINNLRNEGCLTANTRSPDANLDRLPSGGGTIVSDVIVMTLPPKGATLKICFAVPPGEDAKIYSSAGGTLNPLKTNVKNGIACANVKNSGNFMLVGQ
jgi:hypothetical protein